MHTRVEEMDWLRGLAILGVIMIHVSATMVLERPTLLGMMANQLGRFAVPAFLFLSGLGLSLSKRPYPGYLRFVLYRLGRIFPAYVLWSVIHLLVATRGGHHLTLAMVLRAIWEGTGYYHLYFIPLIVHFYLLYPLLRPFLRQTKGLVISLIITLVAQVIANYLYRPSWLHIRDPRNILTGLFYFALGVWCADRVALLKSDRRTLWNVLVTMAGVGLVAEAYAGLAHGKSIGEAVDQMRPPVILYSIIFGAWVWSRQWTDKWLSKVLSFFAEHSFFIYLSHVLLLNEFVAAWRRAGAGVTTPIFFVSAFTVVTGLSVIVALSMKHVGDAVGLLVASKREKPLTRVE